MLKKIYNHLRPTLKRPIVLESTKEDSAKIYFTLFEKMADPVMLIKDDLCINCNEATLKLLGYPNKATFLNQSLGSIFPDFQTDGLRSSEKSKAMNACALQLGFHRFGWRYKCYDGSLVSVDVTLTAVIVKGELFLHTVLHEISERIKADEPLSESKVKESQHSCEEFTRIKAALDSTNTGIMIADHERNIVYLNKAVIEILKNAEADLQQQLPNFSVASLLGNNIDSFHANSSYQSKLLSTMKKPITVQLTIGGRAMSLTASSIVDDLGQRLGSIAEWRDRSFDLLLEQEVIKLIAHISSGDFSQRIDLSSENDLLKQLFIGLNTIFEITEGYVRDNNKMTQLLIDSELRCKRALEGVGDGVWDWNIQTDHASYSTCWKTMLGYAEHDILPTNQEWLKRIHPDDQDQVAVAMQSYLTGKTTTYRVEYRLRDKNNDYIWILGRGTVTRRDLQGQPIQMIGTHTDITQLKLIEQVLKKSQETLESDSHVKTLDLKNSKEELAIITARFQTSFEYAPVGVINISTKGLFLEVNKSYCDFLGYSRDELLIMSFDQLTYPDDHSLDLINFELCLSGASSGFTVENRYIRKDGKMVWGRLTVRLICQLNGLPDYFIEIIEDITWRKQAEAELTKLSSALEQSQSSVMITDLDGTIEYVNQAFVNTTGYSREEIIGQKPSLLRSGKTLQATYEAMWAALLSGKAWQGEVINLNKQGEEIIELTWISPMRDTNGEVTHYLGVKEDITERKQLEQVLQNAKERAEVLLKTKSQFLANMSHEIRTPMNAIIGFSELALLKAMPPEIYAYLQNINTASTALLAILNDILDLSKLEAGRISLIPSPFQLKDLLTTIHGLLINSAQAKNLDLTLNIGIEVPDNLIGDALRLRQVLINLLGNAIKFTKEGSVRLSITLQQLDAVEVRLLFSVTDTGIGIDPVHQDKLFLPFSQVDDGFSRNFEGSGLGLVISQDLIQLMGGEIKVESSVGLGSCFSFELVLPFSPLSNIDSLSAIASSVPGTDLAVFNGVRILVVEDDFFNQQIISEILSRSGATLEIANNGMEALAMLELAEFNAILMDLHMPVMNGFEATKVIRSRARFATLPIIALTASVTQEDRALCLSAGMNGFIGKPIDFKKILCLLEQLIKQSYN